MNIQAMMNQAKKLQGDMEKVKRELNNTIYTGSSGFIKISIYGNLKVDKVEITEDNLEDVEKEMLEDMLKISLTQALDKLNKDKESKLSKFGSGMQGLL